MFNAEYRLKGEYTLTVTSIDGRVRKVGPFPNLITDIGLQRITEGTWIEACALGYSDTAPSVEQTGLFSSAAVQSSSRTNSHIQHPNVYIGDIAEIKETISWRFPVGSISGDLKEVAVGWETQNPFMFWAFSRSLILDQFGNPVTLNILSTDIVDVDYTLSLFVDTSIFSHQLMLDGVQHTVSHRTVWLNSTVYWRIFSRGTNISPRAGVLRYGANVTSVRALPTTSYTDWTDSRLSVDSYQSGHLVSGTNRQDIFEEKNETYSRDTKITWTFPNANFSSGIGWVSTRSRTSTASSLASTYLTRMLRIEPPIMKEDIHDFHITFRNTFARHP